MRKLAILFTVWVAFAVSVNAQNFTGKYEFYENGGKTVGGSVIFISHQMEIKSDGSVSIDADGYQTSKHLIGTTKKIGSRLQVTFQGYKEGNIFTPFVLGDLLLTLEIKQFNGKKVIWTTFGAYQPSTKIAKKVGGIYFRKSKN